MDKNPMGIALIQSRIRWAMPNAPGWGAPIAPGWRHPSHRDGQHPPHRDAILPNISIDILIRNDKLMHNSESNNN